MNTNVKAVRDVLKQLDILDLVERNLDDGDEIRMALIPFYISHKLRDSVGYMVGHSHKSSLKMMNVLLEMVDKDSWESGKYNGLLHKAFLKGYLDRPIEDN